MAHANAALTPKHRLRLARLIVEDGWPPSRAAEFFNVSWRTAAKWAQRYRDEGPAGMLDRSSARHSQHAKTPTPTVRKIVHLRWKQRLGPVEIADRLEMASSTVHAVLVRCRKRCAPSNANFWSFEEAAFTTKHGVAKTKTSARRLLHRNSLNAKWQSTLGKEWRQACSTNLISRDLTRR